MDKHAPHRLPGSSLDEMLDYQLYLLYLDSGRWMEQLIQQKFGLNRRRWRILAALHRVREGASLSELAQAAHLDRTQTSRTVATMCREGWLRRLSRPDNARYAKVVFTDKSRTLYDSILREWEAANRLLLQALEPQEAGALEAIIAKLRARAQQLHQGAA